MKFNNFKCNEWTFTGIQSGGNSDLHVHSNGNYCDLKHSRHFEAPRTHEDDPKLPHRFL